jgi:transposase
MISIPLSEYNELKTLIAELSEKIKKLEEKNSLQRNGKDSNKSSTPPSQDIGRSNKKNLRFKSGLKSGGQLGHEGFTLKMKEDPDEIIEYKPDYCCSCGADLQQVESQVNENKQEVIIPSIRARYIEHRSHTKICPCCNNTCKGYLPDHLKAPIQYGSSVSTVVSYLSVYQYMPYHRISLMFNDIFGIPISEGSIDNMLESSMQKALPAYGVIQQKIQQCEVVGSDETGCHINGKKGWFHTWQNTLLTFIVASLNRGYQTIETYFPNGFPQSVYVSDCWAAQLKTNALHHQLCIVHLLRDLSNFEDALSCTWSKEMKLLFQQAIELKHKLIESDYNQPHQMIMQFEDKLESLLNVDYTNKHPKVKAFIKRLIKNKNSIFTFLHFHNVPADNNGSERAIRNVKVKTKVSGQFRAERGAKRFAVLRSVIDTSIKNSQNVFQALTALENLVPS